MQYEHLAATWDCLIEDNEPEQRVGTITPEMISAQMDRNLRVTSNEAKGIEAFKKRMTIIDDEDYTGYNPSDNFIDNIASLIW